MIITKGRVPLFYVVYTFFSPCLLVSPRTDQVTGPRSTGIPVEVEEHQKETLKRLTGNNEFGHQELDWR